MMSKWFIFCLFALALSLVMADDAWFEVAAYGDTFVIKLSDSEKIMHARRILSGRERYRTHIMGKISKSQESYNREWDFHLESNTIDFFSRQSSNCDYSFSDINYDLPYVCKYYLKNCIVCPLRSRLVRELYLEDLD